MNFISNFDSPRISLKDQFPDTAGRRPKWAARSSGFMGQVAGQSVSVRCDVSQLLGSHEDLDGAYQAGFREGLPRRRRPAISSAPDCTVPPGSPTRIRCGRLLVEAGFSRYPCTHAPPDCRNATLQHVVSMILPSPRAIDWRRASHSACQAGRLTIMAPYRAYPPV